MIALCNFFQDADYYMKTLKNGSIKEYIITHYIQTVETSPFWLWSNDKFTTELTNEDMYIHNSSKIIDSIDLSTNNNCRKQINSLENV